jgi:hypothetical protein
MNLRDEINYRYSTHRKDKKYIDLNFVFKKLKGKMYVGDLAVGGRVREHEA